MKTLSKGILTVVVLVSELCFVIYQNTWIHGDILDVSYRHEQRVAAFYDNLKHPSPTTKSTLNVEVAMMRHHQDLRLFLTLGTFAVINGLGFYYLWKAKGKPDI